jgi:hypothetical protein
MTGGRSLLRHLKFEQTLWKQSSFEKQYISKGREKREAERRVAARPPNRVQPAQRDRQLGKNRERKSRAGRRDPLTSFQ